MMNVEKDCISLTLDEIKGRMEYLFGTEFKRDKFTYFQIINFLDDVYFHYEAMKELDNMIKE